MAPEIFTQKTPANPALDIWSLGCILYRMTHGYAPFDGATRQSIISKITASQFQISNQCIEKFTAECIDLIKKMLTQDKEKRITMNEIINHPWITKKTVDLSVQSYLCFFY